MSDTANTLGPYVGGEHILKRVRVLAYLFSLSMTILSDVYTPAFKTVHGLYSNFN